MTHPDPMDDHVQHAHALAVILGQHGHRRPAIPLALPTVGGSAPIYSGQCILLGWSFVDTSAAANTLVIRQGADATSQPVGAAVVAASGADSRWFGPTGIRCQGGVHVTQTGAVIGAVFILPLT